MAGSPGQRVVGSVDASLPRGDLTGRDGATSIWSPARSQSASLRALIVLAAVGLFSLDSVLLLAKWMDAPFRWWFDDTLLVVGTLVLYICGLGLAFDAALIALGVAARRTRSLAGSSVLALWRRRGFFSLGVWPLYLPALAAYFVVATSNITQISLGTIGRATVWRDPLLWDLESGIHEWVAGAEVPVGAWDLLYHNAWTLEASALFALILLTRSKSTVLAFLTSFVLLFYVGRMLGLLNPVMGPAFYRPELYGYLDGSLTAQIQQILMRLIQAGPGATWHSGVLMGGISAMPSLHVGLVTTCAYWLTVARPRLLLPSLAWIALVWMSTVALGWHYAVDGLGGIVTAWICIAGTRWIMTATGCAPPDRLLGEATWTRLHGNVRIDGRPDPDSPAER